MWLHQLGFTAFAIMGAQPSEAQADRICALGYDKIILGFDNDEAGEKAKDEARKLLGRRADVLTMDYDNFHHKDFHGLSKRTVLNILKTAKLDRGGNNG